MTRTSTMFESAPNGERREAVRSRRWTVYLACLVLAGFVIGFGYAMVEDDATGAIPAWAAITACIAYVVSITLGFAYLKRASDELEVVNNLWAMAAAAFAYLIGYPCWYVLWRGGLVPEPGHEIIFGGVYVALALTYIWRKYF